MKPEPAPPSRIEAFKMTAPVGVSGREWLSVDVGPRRIREYRKMSRRLRA